MPTTATTLYPFVPSGPDFDQALAFFAAIGFEAAWQHGDVAGLRFGGAFFLLQKFDHPEMQRNLMITFEVNDLEAYAIEVAAKDLPALFPGVRVGVPKDFPWGRELHLIDPAGVCWHVRQAGA
jgi:hypothetical protein